MGLAASQARFLGLTARKSNVEYQGQQINQARTALSNEVMNLYQKYNNLDVPVPPSVNEYVKTTYTLDSTAEKYQIDSFTKITGGEYDGYYDVTLKYDEESAKAYPYTAKDAVISATIAGDSISYLSYKIGTDSYYYDENDTENSTIVKITGDYDKYQGLTTVMQALGLTDGTFYMFRKDNKAYYTTENDLLLTEYDEHGMYYGNYTFEYQGTQTNERTVSAKAAITQESSGRLSAITIIDSDDEDLKGNTYSITTGTQDDQKAYDDAMNQYYYDKEVYERQVELINKQTEKIQAEDKALELKLNQLDTEQKAISTEMDSISKVIEDTIDSVFKTFNS
ncbi:MAG: hypothetical protein IJ877_04515 [Candidatus Gastranaerophilales bacterium]|nr:hypothetical protein [Candidatus Gastranaerophilales bacterium]